METKTKKVVINYKAKYEAAMKEVSFLQEKNQELDELTKTIGGEYDYLDAQYKASVEKCSALQAEHESKCNDNAILSQMLDKAQAQLNTIKASWWYKVAKFFGVWE